MDNPGSSKSYDAHDSQFLQQDQERREYRTTGLREAVQEMQETGSNMPVLKTITGIIMMQMSAKTLKPFSKSFFNYTTWEFS